MADQPRLSVLLATPDNFATLRRTVDALRRQTICDAIELVFVIPDSGKFDPVAGELDGFHSFQILEHPVAGKLAEARVAAVKSARASYVAVGEDHSFPHRRWAESLLAAHAKGYRAVGSVMRNPRPNNAIGWADMLTSFISFVHPNEGGISKTIPGHNSSYDRELLLSTGERLRDYLQVEVILHFRMGDEGEELWLEKNAVTTHHNLLNPYRFILHKWKGGLIFGSLRSRDWPLKRRLLVGLLSPIIPPLRLWRMRKDIARIHRQHGCVPRALPWLALALICHGAGEGIGTLFGHGNALESYWKVEFHRIPVKKAPPPAG